MSDAAERQSEQDPNSQQGHQNQDEKPLPNEQGAFQAEEENRTGSPTSNKARESTPANAAPPLSNSTNEKTENDENGNLPGAVEEDNGQPPSTHRSGGEPEQPRQDSHHPSAEDKERSRDEENNPEKPPPDEPQEAWGSKKEDERSDRSVEVGQDLWLEEELPIDFIEHELELDVRDGYLVRELYYYVPFLLLFLAFSLNQIPVEPSFLSVQALKESLYKKTFPLAQDQNTTLWNKLQNNESLYMDLDKTVDDIANVGDWTLYLNEVVQILFNCPNLAQNDPPTTPNILGGMPIPFKAQLYPLGALRFRTIRVRSDSCALSKDVVPSQRLWPSRYNITDLSCWGFLSTAAEETTDRCNRGQLNYTDSLQGLGLTANKSMYKWHRSEDVYGTYTTTETGTYHAGGYIVEIPFNASCQQALDVVNAMQDEDCPFVDPVATRFVTLEMFFYSPASDVFFSAKIFSEVTAGGGVINSGQFRAFLIWTKRLSFQTVLDFIFLAFIFYAFVMFFVEMRKFYREHRRILAYFMNFWVFLEFCNIFIFIAVFCMRWKWWSDSVKGYHQFPWPNEYPALDDLLWLYSQMRYALAFNFIITFLKMIRYLKISSKLNVISTTFEKAQTDVAGLIVLFLLVLTGYSLSAMILFGPNMRQFSSVDRSFAALLFMLLGDMDYDGMKAVQPLLAPVFFWTFLILSFFLLLNFIVAVVGDAFEQAGEQEWTLPMGEAAELSLKQLFRSYRPSALARECRLICRGRSSLWIRNQALAYIKQQYTYLKLKFPNALSIPISAKQLLKWIPLSLRDDYRELLAEDWELLRAVYKLKHQSEDETEERMNRDMISDGARLALVQYSTEESFNVIHDSVLALDDIAKKVEAGLLRRLGKEAMPERVRENVGIAGEASPLGRLRRQQLKRRSTLDVQKALRDGEEPS